MEKTYSEEAQVIKVVSSEKAAERDAKWAKWKGSSLEPPHTKRPRWVRSHSEQRHLERSAWRIPDNFAEIKVLSDQLRELYERDRVRYADDGTVTFRTDKEEFESKVFRDSFFDNRWFRSVYWDPCIQRYESRDYPKPVIWTAPDGWKPETEEEFKERSKDWLFEGTRLDHKQVCVGGKHLLYEGPEHTKVRVTAVNHGKLPPKVYVRLPEGPPGQWGRWIFTDQLDSTVRNSKSSRKNWVKRQIRANKKNGDWPLQGLHRGIF